MQNDIIGQRFGRWVVAALSSQKKYGKPACECICDCGTKRLVAIYRLGTQTFSCGCARLEAATLKNTRHGLHKHPLQTTWRGMKERCYNPQKAAYPRYGGRGIKVCDRWLDLQNFIEDNEQLALPGTTLDRKDNDKDYSPENCRWVTQLVQANNRENCVNLEFRGRTQTVAEWARELGMFEHTLRKRIQDSKWTVEKALTTPVRKRFGSPHKPTMLSPDG
jgi:hypothetical protein